MDPELLSMDDLPVEVRQSIAESDRQISEIRDRARRQADEIRASAEQAAGEIETRAEEEVRHQQLELWRELRPLQDRYAREGKLDQALAIRERVRSLRANLLHAEPDPGSLSHVRTPRIGSTMLFEVTGSSEGIVWGTDVYTSDSTLAAVAVHAGVLQEGERGIVRVTFVDTLNVSFTGSQRHGVWSEPYGPWPVGYRIDRA